MAADSTLAKLALPLVNHLLSQNSWASALLAPFSGREALLNLGSLPGIQFAIDERGYFHPGKTDAADVSITIPINGSAGFDLQKIMAAAQITGSAEFAEVLAFVLRRLRWDAEEDLSRLFGDIIGRRLHQTARTQLANGQSSVQSLAEQTAIYLGHEKQVLLTHSELNSHKKRLQELRDQIARLEKRLDRIGG